MKAELEARKARLMTEVMALIEAFSAETGLYVENVELDVTIVRTDDGLRRHAVYNDIDMRVIQP